MNSIEQQIFDDVVHNALEMFRVMAAEKAAIFRHLEQLKKELVAELANMGGLRTEAQRKSFFKKADKLIAKHYNTIQLQIDFGQIATYVAKETTTNIAVVLGKKALKMPTTYLKTVDSDAILFGAPQSAWWQGQSLTLQRNFEQQVRQGLLSAETNQQIISRIVGKAGQPGIMETSRRSAAALVQTGVQSVANEARRKTFQANSDVIKGLQQVSTLDSHTSLVCISYSECQWDLEFKPIGPKNKQKPYNGGVPRHFNCRSVEIPLTKSFKELGLNIKEPKPIERASESGPISANTSFDDYLKRRGKAYQDDMLGKGRADLWRAGKITLKDLIAANGRPLSVSELTKLAKRRQTRRQQCGYFDPS